MKRSRYIDREGGEDESCSTIYVTAGGELDEGKIKCWMKRTKERIAV